MTIKNLYTTLLLLFSIIGFNLQGQTKLENNAFDAGEKLTYDLYYKYGILNMKGGKATINTESTMYQGEEAYKMTLHASTRGLVGNFFTVDDTLTSYMTKGLVPQLFIKGASEGGDYTRERQIYNYEKGDTSIRAIRYRNGEFKFDETVFTDRCTYDMISILAYARNLDYSDMQRGDNTQVQFITGKRLVDMHIRYMGTTKLKVNNGKKYDAIELSLMILDKAFVDQEEAMRVWITNDENKLPLQIHTNLKIGEMRSILKDFSGNRHPLD